jgi:O-antigen ligase
MTAEAGVDRRAWARCGNLLLLALLVSLASMQPSVTIFGLAANPSDFLYLLLLGSWIAALAAGQAEVRWSRFHGLIALYFAAMAISVPGSEDPGRSAVKLATQLYLLSLPVILASLIGNTDELRRCLRWWLAGSALLALLAILSLLLFFFAPDHPLLAAMRFHYGTLPPGDYPRLKLSFLNANLLCNYLTVTLAILLLVRHMGWIGRRPFLLLAGGTILAALLTLSPGLGGIALALGSWGWLIWRDKRKPLARASLAAGCAAALLFLLASAVTPIVHSTAPFLIALPGELTLAPSARLLLWIEAFANFLSDPLFGRGLGADAAQLRYISPSGAVQSLTDAHNMFLNLAVQCGLPGLAAMLLLIAAVLRACRPFRLATDGSNAVPPALGLTFINALAYQGLTGSFEDARHLWLLLGLFLASRHLRSVPGELPSGLARRDQLFRDVPPMGFGR